MAPDDERRPATMPGPTEWPSERGLRRRALNQIGFVLLGVGLLCLQLADDDDRALETVMVIVYVVLLIALGAQIVGDVRAVHAWRRFPTDADEQLLWGTSAQLILPTGGAGFGGVFALSTTRLRYVPRWAARLRGVRPEEWPVEVLGPVSVEPVDRRRRYRGGRWVVLDVADRGSIVLLNEEQHLVAADLHDALVRAHAAAASARRETPPV